MNKQNIYGDNCPVLYALNMIGGKWRLPIIWSLRDGRLRYNQIKNSLNGITNIMLTRSLQDLEEYGLILRYQLSEKPLHVEYELTQNAKILLPALSKINDWGKVQLANKI